MIPRLSEERIKRRVEETYCDWCGGPLYVGDRVLYNLHRGDAYCSRHCAIEDAADAYIHGGPERAA